MCPNVFEDDFNVNYVDFEKPNIGENKDVNQFVIPKPKENSKEIKVEEYDEDKSYEDLFTGPPPKNRSSYTPEISHDID